MLLRQLRRLGGLGAVSEMQFRHGPAATRARLTRVSSAFMDGLALVLAALDANALDSGALDALSLAHVHPELRGFAMEGMGAGAAIADQLTARGRGAQSPVQERVLPLLIERATPVAAGLHAVGAGWALARLGRPRAQLPAGLPTVLHDQARDGFGFCQGLFHSYRFASPRRFARADGAFDRGLGRSLWFVRGGQAAAMAEIIVGFADTRHPALWTGVGIAAAFTGGVSRAALAALVPASRDCRYALVEGVSLARELRSGLGELPSHTAMAVETLAQD